MYVILVIELAFCTDSYRRQVEYGRFEREGEKYERLFDILYVYILPNAR